jgi:Questin oxidase-like
MSSFFRLSSRIRPGLLNLPGNTPQSKQLVEKLLQEDRERHHCFFNKVGFHNHLSHQSVIVLWVITSTNLSTYITPLSLLAAYDLGASAKVLQAIYDEDVKIQRNIDLGDKDTTIGEIELENLTLENWTTFLGEEK